tara:strand:+ start:40347 stop:41249 length:903 start_codon:yes stop_codon:yes gene_type:complete
MIQSMTGYGKVEFNLKNKNFIIEIKSLNSKTIDINLKIPAIYRDKEIVLRKMLSEKLKRGKVELAIWREKSQINSSYKFDKELIRKYYNQIDSIKKEFETKSKYLKSFFSNNNIDLIPTILKMPDVLIKKDEKIDKEEWIEIEKNINYAIDNLITFREDEGNNLSEDISLRINLIKNHLSKMEAFESQRIEKIKSNINNKLVSLETQDVDQNRFEQELIYYLEKLDITEEKVRLNAHTNYFLESLDSEISNGKKLIFISQEIGREINTIGSKSNNSDMQKLVVQMKDELEKIKEQLLNIL